MFEWLKKFFTDTTFYNHEEVTEIGDLKIMTTDEIVEDNEAFNDISTVIRYLYTKDKERDVVNRIGF